VYPDGGWSNHIAFGTKSEVYNDLKCATSILYYMKNFDKKIR
jgi:hypothetical protein